LGGYCAKVDLIKAPIKISVSTWLGWSHIFLAQEKGFFEKNNVDVELIHIHEHTAAQKPFWRIFLKSSIVITDSKLK